MAYLQINLEKLNYFPGDQVNGQISMMATMPAYASHIKIKCKGREKVFMREKLERQRERSRWVTRNGQRFHETYQETYYVDKEYRDKHRPYDYESNVHNFQDNMIQSGQSMVPFSFILPNHLPTSFEHEWMASGGKSEAKIRYSIKVYCMGLNN